MRYVTHLLAALSALALSACDEQGNLTLGGANLTPAQRCVGYTGAIARYERILAEGGELTGAQQVAYDVALAGQLATCLQPES